MIVYKKVQGAVIFNFFADFMTKETFPWVGYSSYPGEGRGIKTNLNILFVISFITKRSIT